MRSLQLFTTALLLIPSIVSSFVVPGVERGASTATITDQRVQGSLPKDDDSLPNPAWRLALNIGSNNNLFSNAPLSIPILVNCDFTEDGFVLPQSDVVSYTDIHGGVTKPIQGGNWKLSDVNKDGVSQNLQLTLQFPEQLAKRDTVVLPANSQLQLETLVYSQQALKDLENAFINARSEQWQVEAAVEELYKDRDGPKKWNPDTQRWERPRMTVPFTEVVQQNWQLFQKKQETQRRNQARPKSTTLSQAAGVLPGMDDRVYWSKYGVIRWKGGRQVGTWSAEPILTNVPISQLVSR